MRHFKKIDWSISLTMLIACVLTVAAACIEPSGPLGAPNVLYVGTVSSVQITLAQPTLAPGQATQATVVAKSADGEVVGGHVDYSSRHPAIATASSTGRITAISAGTAVIQATVAGRADTASVRVQPSASPVPDSSYFAFNDFNTTTSLGPSSTPFFYAYPSEDLDFPDDPTGSGRGKVARFHYVKSSPLAPADVNRSITNVHTVGWGQTMYFKGDVYFPIASFVGMDRKLLYWQPHHLVYEYGANRTYFMVLQMSGTNLQVVNANGGQTLDWPNIATPSPNTWYTIEVQLTNQSAPGAADGIVTIWIDGAQVYTNTTLAWVPSSWIGVPVPGGNGTPLDASDLSFERFQIGDQVNASGVYDEYRYWDNVGFSAKRIGQ